MTISIDEKKKAYDKINPCVIITPNILDTERMYLNKIMLIYEKPTANILSIMVEKLNVFPLRSRTRQQCPLSPINWKS